MTGRLMQRIAGVVGGLMLMAGGTAAAQVPLSGPAMVPQDTSCARFITVRRDTVPLPTPPDTLRRIRRDSAWASRSALPADSTRERQYRACMQRNAESVTPHDSLRVKGDTSLVPTKP